LNYLTQLLAWGGFIDVGAAKVSDIAIKNLFKSSTMNIEKLSIDILSCKLHLILYDS